MQKQGMSTVVMKGSVRDTRQPASVIQIVSCVKTAAVTSVTRVLKVYKVPHFFMSISTDDSQF